MCQNTVQMPNYHALIAHENLIKLSTSVMKNWIDCKELLQQLLYISYIHSMHENCNNLDT